MTYKPVTKLRMGLWGDVKTAKTSLAMTFPKPIFHVDLDQGFHRVTNRLGGLTYLEWSNYDPNGKMLVEKIAQGHVADIYTKSYQQPLLWPGSKIVGIEDLWNEVVQDVIAAYQLPKIQTVVLDTGSVAWELACNSELERAQRTKEDKQTLGVFEYRRPNNEMRALYGGAKTYDKNFAIVHHMAGVYEPRVNSNGRVSDVKVGDTWKGFKEMGAMVDVVGQTLIHEEKDAQGIIIKRTPRVYIGTCGLTLEMEGRNVDEPTYDNLVGFINEFRREEYDKG